MKSQNKQQWYVVTGGPSSGKTTLVNELVKLGHAGYPEAARTLIDIELAAGRKLEDIQGTADFQKRILEFRIEMEKKAPKDKIVFFDGAIPDGVAYCKLQRLDIEEYKKYYVPGVYRKIFFCRPLKFEKDYARVEDERMAQEIAGMRRQSYQDLGYEIIDLPATPAVSDRVAIVLREIKK